MTWWCYKAFQNLQYETFACFSNIRSYHSKKGKFGKQRHVKWHFYFSKAEIQPAKWRNANNIRTAKINTLLMGEQIR